jgi:uncharacterized protein GlcG (DUF336 family)
MHFTAMNAVASLLVSGVITFAGGPPIMTENKLQIGRIGVSGGTATSAPRPAGCGQDDVK